MFNIKHKEQPSCKVETGTLKPGDTFEYSGDYYLTITNEADQTVFVNIKGYTVDIFDDDDCQIVYKTDFNITLNR